MEVDAVVVGAGQAGLCMSHYLTRHGVRHLVLERARVGERWRSERWDSLRFQFPNAYVRLPGFDYDGDDPTGFMTHRGIVRVLERYASHIAAPVRCGVNVRSVERIDDGRFRLSTGGFEICARNVVLATGPYQRTLVPVVSMQLPARVAQLTASAYTNERALPSGAVLVVGSGGSGVQIAEDLIDAGRTTYLCVGEHRRVPRRHRGRDIMDWLEELGMTTEPQLGSPEVGHAPLLTGVDGGYDVDLRRLVERGGHLLGRLNGVRNGALQLGDTLQGDMAAGDDAYQQFITMIESLLVERGDIAAAEPPPDAGLLPPASPTSLDIDEAGITSVIWATGYGLDFSWVHCGEFDERGVPVHDRGVSPVPGLYFLGLPFLHNARSSFFWGVGDDAAHIARQLTARDSEGGS